MPTSIDLRPTGRPEADAREHMVLRYRPLALSLSRRYRGTGHPREDLEQVACVGLVKAVRRFDPARGFAFSTFAVPTILGELRRFCRDGGWSAHVPRGMQERAGAVRRAGDQLSASQGRVPTVTELAADLRWTEEDVLEALTADSTRTSVPLDAPVDPSGDAGTVLERLGNDDPGFDHVECLAAIETSLPALSRAEQQILRLRFDEDLLLHEIATRLEIPEGRASKLLASALATLRERVRDAEAALEPRRLHPGMRSAEPSPELLAA